MATVKEVKLSKQGWPLGSAEHHVGAIHSSLAETILLKLVTRYGGEWKFSPFLTEPTYGDLIVTARLSMERYGQIRAFVEGYKAASY